MAICKARCCGLAMLTTACVCGAIFIYTAVKFSQYTPLYTPITCNVIGRDRVFEPSENGTTMVKSITYRSCHNPNSYAVEIDNREPGKAYVLENNTLIPLGEYSFNYAKFGPKSTENSSTVMSAPMSEALKYANWDMIRFVTEVKIKTRGDVSLFGMRVASWEPQDETCAVEARLKPTKTYGPIVCGSTWEELVIPSFNATHKAMEMNMDPAALQKKAEKKNAALSVILAITGVIVLWSLSVAVRNLCWKRTTQPSKGNDDARKLSPVMESEASSAPGVENEQV